MKVGFNTIVSNSSNTNFTGKQHSSVEDFYNFAKRVQKEKTKQYMMKSKGTTKKEQKNRHKHVSDNWNEAYNRFCNFIKELPEYIEVFAHMSSGKQGMNEYKIYDVMMARDIRNGDTAELFSLKIQRDGKTETLTSKQFKNSVDNMPKKIEFSNICDAPEQKA